MKKRFLSKSLIAKIALVLVIILLFEFAISEPVGAAELGGTLLRPVVNLVVYLADGVMEILQNALLGIERSFLHINLTDDENTSAIKQAIFGVVSCILIAAVLIGGIYVVAFKVGATLVATAAGVVVSLAIRYKGRNSSYEKSLPNST